MLSLAPSTQPSQSWLLASTLWGMDLIQVPLATGSGFGRTAWLSSHSPDLTWAKLLSRAPALWRCSGHESICSTDGNLPASPQTPDTRVFLHIHRNSKGDRDQRTCGFPLWRRRGHYLHLQETGAWDSGWVTILQMFEKWFCILPNKNSPQDFLLDRGGLLGMCSWLCRPLPTLPSGLLWGQCDPAHTQKRLTFVYCHCRYTFSQKKQKLREGGDCNRLYMSRVYNGTCSDTRIHPRNYHGNRDGETLVFSRACCELALPPLSLQAMTDTLSAMTDLFVFSGLLCKWNRIACILCPAFFS